MKILLLHQFFRTPEGGGAVNSYVRAKALVDHRHEVTVITTSSERNYRVDQVDGITVHYLPIPYDNRLGFYGRGGAFIKYVFGACRLAAKFSDFDRCYAISVPLTVGIAARWIKFRHRIPYFFEVGDLWPDAPVQMGYIRSYFLKSALFALEKSIYRHAKAIVALSPPIQSAIASRAKGKPVFMIPNMADCEFFRPALKSPARETELGVQGKFVIGYLGALGVANGVDFLLRCAALPATRNLPVHFILCGKGATGDSLKAMARQLDLKNVTFLPHTSRSGVKDILNVCDAVAVTYEKFAILETGSPNKFFDGLAAGKMILVNFGGWIKDEIMAHHCGVYIDPRRPEEFPAVIKPFLENPDLLRQHQAAARKLGEDKYSRERLTGEFVRIFS